MEIVIEEIVIYSAVALLCGVIIFRYLRSQTNKSKVVQEKIENAKVEGLFEPISLHPVVDVNSCIKSGACITACPEKDILGIVNGKATTINASECIGHGACFHACPVEAITLCVGTERRGVDLPHINQNFETNIKGIYISGELGGMGLIRNAVEQGKQTVQNIYNSKNYKDKPGLNLLIVGAGPAGIAAALMATKLGLSFDILDQDTLGGTVFTFPRSKIVMTSPMDLPLYGKIKLYETSKSELLDLWNTVLDRNNIKITENVKVDSILITEEGFEIFTNTDEKYIASNVVLSIGRRGTPRKLNVPGEKLEKVAYRLLEPENISNKDIAVVGGGDSAIESALLLMNDNRVTLTYRGESFKRLKPKNRQKVLEAIEGKNIDVLFNSNVTEIKEDHLKMSFNDDREDTIIKNDLIYIFAGGELPTSFLDKTGIQISKRFGYALLKH